MKRFVSVVVILILAWGAGRADSVKGDKLSLTFNSLLPCDSVRLKLGFPDTTATPDTVMPAINVLMHHIATSDGENWVYYKPAGLDSLGTLTVDIIYYIGGVGEHAIGAWLSHDQPTLFSGLGDKDDTLYVLDSSDSSAIANITIRVEPNGGGTPYGRTMTGAAGTTILNLNNGDYDIWASGQGYIFVNPYDVNVLGNESDTILIQRFAPSAPAPDMTAIFAWLTTAGGDTINPSRIRYRPLKPDSIGDILYVYEGDTSYYREYTENEKLNYGSGSNQIVIIKKWTDKSSAQSYLPINLYPNSLLTDTTSVYDFEATYRPAGGRDYIARHVITPVPDTTAFNPFAE